MFEFGIRNGEVTGKWKSECGLWPAVAIGAYAPEGRWKRLEGGKDSLGQGAWSIGHRHRALGSNSKPSAGNDLNELNDPNEPNLLNQPQNIQGK
jgi:hypothetical protein